MPFTCKHLTDVKMTYLQHLLGTFVLSFWCLLTALIFFIHGIFPSVFQETGSNELAKISKHITDLHQRFKNKDKEHKEDTIIDCRTPSSEIVFPFLHEDRCPLTDISPFRKRNFSI